MEGAEHIEFHPETGLDTAKKILRLAIDNYPNRRHNVTIPQYSADGVVGFSHETIHYLLGGLFRGELQAPQRQHHQRPHPGSGRRRGLQQRRGPPHDAATEMVKELLKNDVVVLTTGCAAMAAANTAC